MRALTQLLLVLSVGAFASAQDTYWRHMLTTFGPIPGIGAAFAAQPRTLQELTDDGWVQISSCADNNPKYLLVDEYHEYVLCICPLVASQEIGSSVALTTKTWLSSWTAMVTLLASRRLS